MHHTVRTARAAAPAICAALLLTTTCAPAPRALAQSVSPEAVKLRLDRAEKRYAGFKSLSEDIQGRLSVVAPGDSVNADLEGSAQMAHGNKLRLEMTVTFFAADHHVLIVSDGRKVWEYDADDHTYTERPIAEVAKTPEAFAEWVAQRTGDISTALFMLAGHPEPKRSTKHSEHAAERTVDGRPMLTLSAKGPIGAGAIGTYTAYFDAKDLLFRRFSVTGPLRKTHGVPLKLDVVFNYADVTPNADLPDDAFDFTPPEDARQVASIKPFLQRAMDIEHAAP